MKLSHLTDHILHKDLLQLAKQEREIHAKVLWHLKEIDQRKLYSDKKCKSLFDYCVTYLGYSEGEASRRVSACRLLKEIPEVAKKIESGELNLTQLNLASKFFQDEKVQEKEAKKKILDQMVGKSCRQSEQMLWEMKKEEGPRLVHVTLKETTVKRLRGMQERKAHIYKDLDGLLEDMCEEVEEIWRPKATRPAVFVASSGRYVPVRVRANVWSRDQGMCQICGSKRSLQYDHVKPFALGGGSTEENLRLLCRNCNQRQGMIQFGKKGGVIERR